MRVLVALISAAASLSGSAFARAIPDAEVLNLTAANEGSPDIYTCGYVYTERGNLGDYIHLPAWQVVTHKYMKAYVVSPECACRFWNDEKAIVIGSGVQGAYFPEGDMIHAGCWHDGHSGHLETIGFEVNGIEAKGLEAKDVAGSAKGISADKPPHTISCGHVYSGWNSGGKSYELFAWKNTNAYVNSYNITGECLCTFRIGKPGHESPTVLLKGPIKGNLEDEAFWVLCEQGFGPPPSSKRDFAVSVQEASVSETSPDKTSSDTIYCGYVYQAPDLRGFQKTLVAEQDTKAYVKSYIISGECLCTFRIGDPGSESPSIQLKGPIQGNLKALAFTTYCTQEGAAKQDSVEKRDESKEPATPAPALLSIQTQYCGYAFTAKGLRAEVRDLPMEQVLGIDTQFRSFIISGECECSFQTGGPSHEGTREIVGGPLQGDLLRDSYQAYCYPRGSVDKRSEADDNAVAPSPPSPANEKAFYCGYAYTEPGLRGTSSPALQSTRAERAPLPNTWKSYIISGYCWCKFSRMTGAEEVVGPIQGNLQAAFDYVICLETWPKKRDGHIKRGLGGAVDIPEPQEIAVTAPVPASEDVLYCGYAYTERGLRGNSSPPLGTDIVYPAPHPKQFESYIISGQCSCKFDSHTIIGPTQGDLEKPADGVKCLGTESRKREEGRAVAAAEDFVAAALASPSPKTPYCGYAYSGHHLRGTQISLPGDKSAVYYKFYKELHHLRQLQLQVYLQGQRQREHPGHLRAEAGRARSRCRKGRV